ncbi:MAG: DUF2723 domain-containing protein [Anaerolineaceae bacterium]|nr:DUF2723 domain-containing protein [Anaerolineaceae bacterium]
MFKKITNPNFFVAIITGGFFLLYGSMLPGRLTGADYAGDGGDLMSAILTGGIAHPTGYPTYLILGRLFQYLLIGSPYFRGALLSAVSAAMAVGLLFLWEKSEINQTGMASIIALLISAVLLGVSPLFWSQAVIVEVYALEMLFLVLVLWWFHVLVYSEPSNQLRILVSILSVCIGLAIGDHVTIVLVGPVCLYGLFLAWRKGSSWIFLTFQAVCFVIGLSVYLYLPLQARSYPPINWGNPQSWQGFLWELTGNPYQRLLFHLPLSQFMGRMSAWTNLLLDQFGIPGLLFGLIGVVQSTELNKITRVILAWIFAVYTVFSIGYNTADSVVYLLPSFIVFSVWIGLGILLVLRLKWSQYPFGKFLVAIFVVFMLVKLPAIYHRVDPRIDSSPASYAENYLKIVPKNALILASEDEDSFPLWYYHYGLGWRPDVRVIVLPLTQFDWYQVTIQHIYPDLVTDPLLDGADNWGEDLVKLNPKRTVCRSTVDAHAEYGVAINCLSKPSS